ncbi:MAG: hypothetical protein ACTSYC_11625, partial [Promethearchaeota archaeon]
MGLTLESKASLYLGQKVEIKRRFTNNEIKLREKFFYLTKIQPDNIISINSYMFFFLEPENYYKAKRFIRTLKREFGKNIRLIRFMNKEDILLILITSLFSEIFINDYGYYFDAKKQMDTIVIETLTLQDRGFAIGKNGEYIKAVNFLLSNHVLY